MKVYVVIAKDARGFAVCSPEIRPGRETNREFRAFATRDEADEFAAGLRREADRMTWPAGKPEFRTFEHDTANKFDPNNFGSKWRLH